MPHRGWAAPGEHSGGKGSSGRGCCSPGQILRNPGHPSRQEGVPGSAQQGPCSRLGGKRGYVQFGEVKQCLIKGLPIWGRTGENLREKRAIPEPVPRSTASPRRGCQGEWSTLLEKEWHGEGCLTEAVAECGGRPLPIWQGGGWRPSLPLRPLGLLQYHLWVNAEETHDASEAGVPPGTEQGGGWM